MIKFIARHPVSDFAIWYAGYKSASDFHVASGVIKSSVFQSIDDPNDVTVTHDFETIRAARAFEAHPKLKALRLEFGITGIPTVWFVKKVD